MSKSDIMKSLSPQEQQCLGKIVSIQDYYKLNDHKKLISIILDPKQCAKFFNSDKVMISDMFGPSNSQDNQRQKNKIFAQKYTYQQLVEKFPRPKAGTNDVLIQILGKKMQKEVITSHQTRKNIWLLASGAKFSMLTHKGLFSSLVNFSDYPPYYERQIGLDLNRTVSKSKQNALEDMSALKNLLTAFARKNPYIGYCQGLNFIAYFILMMQFTQEEGFWLLCQITETIIPMDYYTNMIGVVCDQQIFIQILRNLKPRITDKFKEVDLNASVLSIEWFVCLFTSSLPLYLVKILWDRLFVEGTSAFIKAGVIIMTQFEKDILAATQFHEIIFILQKGTKNLQIPEQEFNARFEKIYINGRGLKLARQLYREYHIMEKLAEKVPANNRQRKEQKHQCKTSWPICWRGLDKAKRQKFQIEVWTYRQENPPKLIHDYLLSEDRNKNNMRSTINSPSMIKQKSTKQDSSSPADLVMGRMQHICYVQSSGFVKRNNKAPNQKINPLKTILEVTQPENISQYMAQENKENLEEEDDQNQCHIKKQLQKLSFFEAQNGNGVMRSQTVQFFTNFAQNNKELAALITKEQRGQ